jgi:hypothetical protein
VRVEQEEGDLFRREIGLARDCGKRGSVGTGLLLLAIDHMTGGAPALGEVGAVVCIGGHRERSAQPGCGNDQNPNLPQNCNHPTFSFDLK